MVLIPNHKKLVNACYPKDPLPESCAPDANSLGKLTYYASRRPEKLSKVAGYLLSWAESQATAQTTPRGRGGLICTLDIFKALVEACPSQLAYFGVDVLAAVELGLGRVDQNTWAGDLDVAGKAEGLFWAFTTFATGALIGVEDHVTQTYMRLLARFSALARGSVKAREHSLSIGIRLISVGALEGSIMSEALYTSEYSRQTNCIVPALVHNITPGRGADLATVAEASTLDKDLNPRPKHSIRLPLAERRVRSIRHTIQGGSDAPPTEADVAAAALHALRALFRLANARQADLAFAPICDHIDGISSGSLWGNTTWCSWLAASITTWVHPQYRSSIISSIVGKLLHSAGVVDKSAAHKPATLAFMLTHVLSGPTSVVGLGVGAVLSDLLSVIQQRARIGGADDPTLKATVDAVTALGTHIYYSEQIEDLCRDIISEANELRSGRSLAGTPPIEAASNAREAALEALSGCLEGVIRAAHQGPGKVTHTVPVAASPRRDSTSTNRSQDAVGGPLMKVEHSRMRSPVSLAVWERSLGLLRDSSYAVRVAYGKALLVFLTQEVILLGQSEPDSSDNARDQSVDKFRFLHAFWSTAYNLAIPSTSGLGSLQSSACPSSTHLESPAKRPRDRAGSATSSTPTSDGTEGGERMALPMDYTLLKECAVAAQRAPYWSGSNVMVGVPVLLALDQEAGDKWTARGDPTRRHASREIAAAAIRALGDFWELNPIKTAGEAAETNLQPSVCPDLEGTRLPPLFGAGKSEEQDISGTAPVLDRTLIIETLSASLEVQRATELDRTQLRTELEKEWSFEDSLHFSEVRSLDDPRKLSTASLCARIADISGRSRSRSMRSLNPPSVSDLRRSLGGSRSGDLHSKSPSPKLTTTSDRSRGASALDRTKSHKRSIPRSQVLAQLRQASDHVRSQPPATLIITPPYEV